MQFLGFARFDSFQYVLVSEWVENESLLYYLEYHPEANRIELVSTSFLFGYVYALTLLDVTHCARTPVPP